jgi:type I restriction enzyme M protein
MIPENSVVVSTRATIGRIAINRVPIATNQGFKNVVIEDSERAVPEYVALALTKLVPTMEAWATGGTFAEISKSKFCELQIPLPPLEVQKEIVAEIEGYQKVINGARAVLDNYRPHIPIHPDWPETTIGECCEVKGGKRLPMGEQFSNVPTKHPYIRVTDLGEQTVDLNNLKFIPEEIHRQISRYTISSADVYISIAGTIGLMGTVPDELDGANLTENAAKLMFNANVIDKRFLSIVGNGEPVQSQIRSLPPVPI